MTDYNPGSEKLKELNNPIPGEFLQNTLKTANNRSIRNKWYIFFPEDGAKIYFSNKEDKEKILKRYLLHFKHNKDYTNYKFGFNKSIN